MQELAAGFVPVADEVSRLQRDREPDCRFFQGFSEKGHYGGRTRPSNTRQGIYAVTATGEFLASINTRDPGAVAKMLTEAQAKFAAMPRAQRTGDKPALDAAAVRRFETLQPDDGLVLQVFTRDLPRARVTQGWRGEAWNQDHAWLRRDEAASLVPAAAIGAERAMPLPILHRLVRAHLVDNVRGQTFAHRVEDIESAQLVLRTTALDGDESVLHMEGAVRVDRRGTWATRGYGEHSAQRLGYDAVLRGTARFDRRSGTFTRFQLLAVGLRWGATEFNGRQDDFGPAPMGVAFALAPAEVACAAPSHPWVYEWGR